MSAILRRSDKGVFCRCRREDLSRREYLIKVKQKAKRNHCYYRALKQSERMLLDLTIRVVQKIRSFILAKLVSQIMDKLLEAMESKVYRLMRTEGRCLAEKISRIGQAWGCSSAKFWVNDRGFIQYLTVSNLSSLKT